MFDSSVKGSRRSRINVALLVISIILRLQRVEGVGTDLQLI